MSIDLCPARIMAEAARRRACMVRGHVRRAPACLLRPDKRRGTRASDDATPVLGRNVSFTTGGGVRRHTSVAIY